jgi:hypothetical protein
MKPRSVLEKLLGGWIFSDGVSGPLTTMKLLVFCTPIRVHMTFPSIVSNRSPSQLLRLRGHQKSQILFGDECRHAYAHTGRSLATPVNVSGFESTAADHYLTKETTNGLDQLDSVISPEGNSGES